MPSASNMHGDTFLHMSQYSSERTQETEIGRERHRERKKNVRTRTHTRANTHTVSIYPPCSIWWEFVNHASSLKCLRKSQNYIRQPLARCLCFPEPYWCSRYGHWTRILFGVQEVYFLGRCPVVVSRSSYPCPLSCFADKRSVSLAVTFN